MCEDHPTTDPAHDGAPALDRRSLLRLGAGAVTVRALTSVEPATAAGPGRAAGDKVIKKVFRGQFSDPATADWHYLPFRVPRGIRKIHVSYEFQPTDTGLGISYNVVDIGIFDGDGHGLGDGAGFRGWSGGARREFTITRSGATPGYLAGPIRAGKWAVLLGPYQITPPGTPYTVVVRMFRGPRGERFEPTPAPQEVPGTPAGWYRGDLHLHTLHSDGSRTETQMIEAALAAGLDFIGSSDHNTSSATYVWGRHVPDGFLVINGEEVTTRSGHWLATGLPPMTWVDWRYRAEDDELHVFADKVRALGGVAVACHPNNPVPSIRWDHGYDHVDAIEAWNGPWTGDDQKTVTDWHNRLVQGSYLPIIGNSDSHNTSQTVGLAQTSYRLATLSAAEVVAAVRGGHAWIAESSGVALTFTATLGDATAECGDQLPAAPDDTVVVTLTASGVPGSLGRILGPSGGPLAFGVADDTGALTLEASVPAGTTPFVRAEVGRPRGDVVSPVEGTPIDKMAALTNPIFITPR